MFTHTEILPTLLFSSLGALFCLLCVVLEYFKGKNSEKFSKFQKMRILSFVLGALIFFLYALGDLGLFLRRDPLYYVLYWWITLSLTLLLYLFALLDYREFIKPKNSPTLFNKKMSLPFNSVDRNPPSGTLIQKPLEEVPENPIYPPTVH